MFAYIEKKLKRAAILNMLGGICGFFIGALREDPIVGILYLAIGLFGSWIIYGFAELLECQKEIRDILKFSFSQDFSKANDEEFGKIQKEN